MVQIDNPLGSAPSDLSIGFRSEILQSPNHLERLSNSVPVEVVYASVGEQGSIGVIDQNSINLEDPCLGCKLRERFVQLKDRNENPMMRVRCYLFLSSNGYRVREAVEAMIGDSGLKGRDLEEFLKGVIETDEIDGEIRQMCEMRLSEYRRVDRLSLMRNESITTEERFKAALFVMGDVVFRREATAIIRSALGDNRVGVTLQFFGFTKMIEAGLIDYKDEAVRGVVSDILGRSELSLSREDIPMAIHIYSFMGKSVIILENIKKRFESDIVRNEFDKKLQELEKGLSDGYSIMNEIPEVSCLSPWTSLLYELSAWLD